MSAELGLMQRSMAAKNKNSHQPYMCVCVETVASETVCVVFVVDGAGWNAIINNYYNAFVALNEIRAN